MTRHAAQGRGGQGQGEDPVMTGVVRLACDGLWLCDLFGLAPPSAPRRRSFATALELLLDGAP